MTLEVSPLRHTHKRLPVRLRSFTEMRRKEWESYHTPAADTYYSRVNKDEE